MTSISVTRRKDHQDHFISYHDMSRVLCREDDYRVISRFGQDKSHMIIAIHGGMIERGTSEIAGQIAQEDYALYAFEGIKEVFDYDALHISSNHFNEPVFQAMVSGHKNVVSIHGCRDDWGPAILVGGLNIDLAGNICEELKARGIKAMDRDHAFPATNPMNVCNRGTQNAGVQLEIPRYLRDNVFAQHIIANSVRSALLT